MTAEQQLQLIEELVPACDTGSVPEITEVMNRHFYSLKTARSVFCVSDQQYERDYMPSSRVFSGKGYLHSLLASSRVMNVKNFDEGKNFGHTFTISLDTQFVSYLRSRFRQHQIVGQDAAITEALQYLARFRSGLDVIPYLYENNDRLDSIEVAESLECFVQFKHAAETPLVEEGRIEPTLSAAKQKKQVCDLLSLIKGNDWQVLALDAKQNWTVAYITLLHAVSIQLAYHNKSIANKMKLMLEKLDEVGLLPKQEIHFVSALFERGSDESFFRKVQTNGADLMANLRSMAWDLAHYRTVVKQVSQVAQLSAEHADFVSPFILTFDQPLQALLNKYHINGLISYKEGQAVKYIVIYPLPIEEALSSALNKSTHLLEPSRRRQRLERGRHFFDSADRQRDCIQDAEAHLVSVLTSKQPQTGRTP